MVVEDGGGEVFVGKMGGRKVGEVFGGNGDVVGNVGYGVGVEVEVGLGDWDV